MLVAPLVAAALWMAAPAAHADDAAAHALLERPGAQAPAALALHQPAQQDADPLRGDAAGRPARAQGRGRPVLRQPRASPPSVPLNPATTLAWRWRVDSFVEGRRPAHPRRRRRRGQALRVLRLSGRAPVLRRAHPAGAGAPHHRRRGAERSAVLRVGQQGSQGQRARQRLHPPHAHDGARVRARPPRPAPGSASAATCWPTTSAPSATRPAARCPTWWRSRSRPTPTTRTGHGVAYFSDIELRGFATTRSAGFVRPPRRRSAE